MSSAYYRESLVIRILGMLIFLSFFVFAGIYNLAFIKSNGMDFGDGFEYWEIARQIIQEPTKKPIHNGTSDSPDITSIDRVSLHAMNVIALNFFGINDYAMHMLISLLYLLNASIVFAMTWRLGGNVIAGASAGILSLFLPPMLYFSNIDYPHIYSATFVLLMILALSFALSFSERLPRNIGVTIAGFFCAMGVFTHEDLALVSVGLAIVLITSSLDAVRKKYILSAPNIKDVITDGIYTFIGIIIAILLCCIVSKTYPIQIWEGFLSTNHFMLNHATIRYINGADPIATQIRILEDFFVRTLGLPIAIIIMLNAVYYIWQKANQSVDANPTKRFFVITLIITSVYTIIFVATSNHYLEWTYTRLFIPFVGPLLITAFSSTAQQLKSRIVLSVLCPILAITTFLQTLSYTENLTFNFTLYHPTVNRQTYDAVKDIVTPDAKLFLPNCYGIPFAWSAIGSKVYLGTNIVPLHLINKYEDFWDIVNENHVRYVMVVNRVVTGEPFMYKSQIQHLFSIVYKYPISQEMIQSLPVPSGVLVGDIRAIWTNELCEVENKALLSRLHERNSKKIITIDGIGDIYDLQLHSHSSL